MLSQPRPHSQAIVGYASLLQFIGVLGGSPVIQALQAEIAIVGAVPVGGSGLVVVLIVQTLQAEVAIVGAVPVAGRLLFLLG